MATICQSSPLILSANTAGANFTTPAALSTVNAPVVVNHLNAEQSFNAIVFPNPAKNTAVVRLSGNENEVVINITDISGKLLWKSMKIKDQQVTLPIEKFANGMYIITVNNGKEIKVLKLIKE